MYMHNWGGAGFNSMAYSGQPSWLSIFAPFIILFIVWSIFWKGLALWHSAQRGQYWWFVVMLIVNTLGILEIIYLFAVAKLKFDQLFSSSHHHNH